VSLALANKGFIMDSLFFTRPGTPEEVIQLGELPMPEPRDNEVLIKVLAAPVQPADYMFIGARYRVTPNYPQPAGLEGIGIVERVGGKLSDELLGTRVAFRSPGSWSEFTVAPANRIYAVPPDISDVVASQFALNPLTSIALAKAADVRSGERVLLTAGKSVVAQICSAILLRRGVEVDLLLRHDQKYKLIEANNEKVIGTGSSVVQALSSVPSRTYDAILDAVGGRDVPALIDSCNVGARLVSYGLLDPSDFTMAISKVIFKSLKWQGFGLDGWLNSTNSDTLSSAQTELWGILREKPSLLESSNVFEYQDYLKALETVRSSHSVGKVVFVR
jgi:NADPH2:quinone reductase